MAGMSRLELLQACWIRAADRLPPADMNKRIIVWLEFGGEPWVCVAGAARKFIEAQKAGEGVATLHPGLYISHWMELPAPKEYT